MIYRTRECGSEECAKLEPCKFQYRELTCLQKSETHISRTNHHNVENDHDLDQSFYGIHESVKEKIETLIYERGIFYPYKLEMSLRKEEISPKLMPKLTQIQTYIKRRRMLLGDDNNMQGVSSDR